MIYLNNAATSFPKPKGVIEAVIKEMHAIPFHSSRSSLHSEVENTIEKCRGKLAAMFNVKEPENIIFTSGATESLNLVFRGLDLRGKHVITTVSEHNSVIRPLKLLEKQGVIDLSFVSSNKDGTVYDTEIGGLIQSNTKLIVVNHCSNVTGNCNDINEIGRLCKKENLLFLVDASQSAGIIPIDIELSHVDILVFTGHKSLYGLRGLGGVYISKDLVIDPLKVGGTGTKSELLYQPETRPVIYEAGTPNTPGIVSLLAGLNFLHKIGLDTIRKRETRAMQFLLNEICKIDRIILYGDYTTEHRAPIMSFTIEDMPPGDVGYILENSFKIIVRSGLHCAPLIHKSLGSYPRGSVRVSLSYFTKDEDIANFIKALKQIVSMKLH